MLLSKNVLVETFIKTWFLSAFGEFIHYKQEECFKTEFWLLLILNPFSWLSKESASFELLFVKEGNSRVWMAPFFHCLGLSSQYQEDHWMSMRLHFQLTDSHFFF